jgi:hypothetical protein
MTPIRNQQQSLAAFDHFVLALRLSHVLQERPSNKDAPVAQLDRVPDYESVGRRFESCRAYQFTDAVED